MSQSAIVSEISRTWKHFQEIRNIYVKIVAINRQFFIIELIAKVAKFLGSTKADADQKIAQIIGIAFEAIQIC